MEQISLDFERYDIETILYLSTEAVITQSPLFNLDLLILNALLH